MAETWDPIGHLREKYGHVGPVSKWADGAFERILEIDPLALAVPEIAERVGTWGRKKIEYYYTRRALADVMNSVLIEHQNWCCDNERERHWIAGALAKRMGRVCHHNFRVIEYGAIQVEWCARCGVLKLGDVIHLPGLRTTPCSSLQEVGE